MSRGSARLPLIAGNWKMHNNHLEALALVQKLAFTLNAKDFAAAEVAVLPPFTALRSVQTLVMGDKLDIRYGAQDISPHDDGAYTGDVSGSMLAKLGCSYVLAGHSERRQYHGEDDALVNAKVKAAPGGRPPGAHHGAAGRGTGQGARGEGRRAGDRLRAGLGDRHRRGRQPAGRAGGRGGHPEPGFRGSRRRCSRECAYPVWRVG